MGIELRLFLKRINWINLVFFTLTPLAALVVTPIYHYFYGWEWQIAAMTVVLASFSAVSITGGYHRLLSHRAYESRTWLKVLYLLFGASSFEGSALLWCTDHRRHHRYIDTDQDPYNIKRGFFYAHIGWILKKSDINYDAIFPKDLIEDKWVRWQHQYYLPLAILMTFGFPTVVGWALGSPVGGFVYGGILRVVLNQHSTFLINSFCHMFGRQPYGNQNTAKDSFLISVFTFGEGYHNFHHHFQSDYRNGVRWYDWDPTKWFIRMMSWVGGCYRLKMIPYGHILKARMAMELENLSKKGVPSDRLQALKTRVEETQVQFKKIYADYLEVAKQGRENRRIHIKAELKLAKIEFRSAFKQWVAYTRMMQRLSQAA